MAGLASIFSLQKRKNSDLRSEGRERGREVGRRDTDWAKLFVNCQMSRKKAPQTTYFQFTHVGRGRRDGRKEGREEG